jgi:hypothetical protein
MAEHLDADALLEVEWVLGVEQSESFNSGHSVFNDLWSASRYSDLCPSRSNVRLFLKRLLVVLNYIRKVKASKFPLRPII